MLQVAPEWGRGRGEARRGMVGEGCKERKRNLVREAREREGGGRQGEGGGKERDSRSGV